MTLATMANCDYVGCGRKGLAMEWGKMWQLVEKNRLYTLRNPGYGRDGEGRLDTHNYTSDPDAVHLVCSMACALKFLSRVSTEMINDKS